MHENCYGRVAANGQGVGQGQEIGAARRAFREKMESFPEDPIPPYTSFWLPLCVPCGNSVLRRAR
jgi:hypothetical protein